MKKTMLSRKIISASVSSAIFALLLSFIEPNPFGGRIETFSSYLLSVSSILPVYLIYIFLAVVVYGIVSSIISDKVGQILAKKSKDKRIEFFGSLSLHLLFGLVLLLHSLGASILFFLVDRLLMKKQSTYTWKQALISLLIPIFVWLAAMGVVWTEAYIETIS